MRLRRGTSYRSVAGGGIEGAVERRFLRCLFTLYTRVGAFTNQVYSVLKNFVYSKEQPFKTTLQHRSFEYFCL